MTATADGATALSIDKGVSDTTLLDETISANFDRIATIWPDNEALVAVHQDRRFTYAELGAEIDTLARGLMAAGLEVGDRVGIWSPNYLEWTLVQYATAKIGVILVTINPAYRTSELVYAINQSGCRMLIAAPEFKTSNYRSMVTECAGEMPGLEASIYFWSAEWDELSAAASQISPAQLAERAASLSPDDPINIQYTSGTTGFPKGATLTHRNILNNGYFVGEGCTYDEKDRVCIPVPFYHCFGMVMGNLGCTSHGATMVIPSDAFEPEAVLRAMQDERCTSIYGVPTMFIAMLDHPDFESFDLEPLRTGIMAGSPCPIEVMKQVVERMGAHEVGICYGMTETSPVSTQTAADDDLDRRCGSVGTVLPHIEIKVIDPDTGDIVPRGTGGEFCTRGYSVMQGYWNEPEKTAAAIDDEGFMHSGDLAIMDDQGYVNIIGRIKDMIIRGGENVYPREIEEFLYTHPDVSDVQVIGVPDDRYGEEIMAWISLRDGAEVSEDDIKTFCRGKIAHFKVPRYVKFVSEFPMTVTGKVRKNDMRDQSAAELGLTESETA